MVFVILICLGIPAVLMAVLFWMTPSETKGYTVGLFALAAIAAVIFSATYGSQNGGGHLPALSGPIALLLFGGAWVLFGSVIWSVFHLVASLKKKEIAQRVGISAAVILILSAGIGAKLVLEAREAHAIAEKSRR